MTPAFSAARSLGTRYHDLQNYFGALIREPRFMLADAIAIGGAVSASFLLALTFASPRNVDTIARVFETICMSNASTTDGRPVGVVTPVTSKALPNVPGQRITIVRVTYAPGGYTPPHRHAGSVTAYVVSGSIRSQLAGGPLETFTAGQSFFEPPGAFHIVSENASMTEPAELLAVFVAEEGATLTVFD